MFWKFMDWLFPDRVNTRLEIAKMRKVEHQRQRKNRMERARRLRNKNR